MKANLEYFKQNFFGYRMDRFPVCFTEKKALRSCTNCEGTGRKSRSELTDYHKREYDTFHEDCETCNGQGRVIVTDIFISFGDMRYNPKTNGSSVSNILFETSEEPYTQELAKDIENESEVKKFYFNVEDVKEWQN